MLMKILFYADENIVLKLMLKALLILMLKFLLFLTLTLISMLKLILMLMKMIIGLSPVGGGAPWIPPHLLANVQMSLLTTLHHNTLTI